MAVVYFDSSAFVKLLVEEQGTELAVALWDGCDAAVSSRLAYPEVRAALAAAARAGRVDDRDLPSIERDWQQYWAAVRTIELSETLALHAGDLCRDHKLRGADGVHLASSLLLAGTDLVIAVWDQQLTAAAIAMGLRVAPAPRSI